MKVLLHSFDCKGKQNDWNKERFSELVSFLHHQSACSSAPQHSFVSTSVFLRQHSSTFKAGQTEVHLTEQGEYEWRNKVKFRLFFNHSYWGFMEVVLLKKARKDHEYWKKTGNVKIMKRITDLLNDIQKHPFTGIDAPWAVFFTSALFDEWPSYRHTNEFRTHTCLCEPHLFVCAEVICQSVRKSSVSQCDAHFSIVAMERLKG